MPEPKTREARALGAWIVGVGLHPICLAIYEHFHFGGARSVTQLARLGGAVLVASQIGRLTLGSLPWWVTLSLHASVTAWWVRTAYSVAYSKRQRALHPTGTAAAIAAGIPLAILQWFS